jgi:hypothetical protein
MWALALPPQDKLMTPAPAEVAQQAQNLEYQICALFDASAQVVVFACRIREPQ